MQDNQTREARAADLIRTHGALAVDRALADFNTLMDAGDEVSAFEVFQVLQAVWDLEDEPTLPDHGPK